MANKGNKSKREQSTQKYIDELSKRYSKLNIIRVDLSYKKPHANTITLEEANRDFTHMLNNRRSKPSVFENNVGYVCKRECTADRGLHFHAMFIYDGQKVQKSSFKANQIGEYWKQLTNNKGSFHNCHRNKYKDNGIGMFEHRDNTKREKLDNNVISYLCKDEQSIKPKSQNKKDRAFTRGTLPRSKGNRGRKRGGSL
jgi:hypothetical protein